MPIDHKKSSSLFSQRGQYIKGGIGRWYWDFRDRQMFKFIESGDNAILDIGCGEGITLQKLVGKFPNKDIKGIDIMIENVKICEKHGLPVNYGSVYNLKIDNNSIDCVVFLEVIEHLNNYQKALSEIYRVLKPGGSLIIIFPNDMIFKIARILTFKFKEAFCNPGHVKQWTPKIVKSALEQLGFEILKTENIPFYFWPCSLHCLIMAKKKLIFRKYFENDYKKEK